MCDNKYYTWCNFWTKSLIWTRQSDGAILCMMDGTIILTTNVNDLHGRHKLPKHVTWFAYQPTWPRVFFGFFSLNFIATFLISKEPLMISRLLMRFGYSTHAYWVSHTILNVYYLGTKLHELAFIMWFRYHGWINKVISVCDMILTFHGHFICKSNLIAHINVWYGVSSKVRLGNLVFLFKWMTWWMMKFVSFLRKCMYLE